MRILFLSFYFQPDLSAGSFRNTALVKALSEQLSEESTIDVLTVLPNRYASYSVDAQEYENLGGVSIERVSLPAHKSGMLDQSRAFITFFREVTKRTRNRKYDIVFASSSRLMTATLGAFIARKLDVPLYLDIRDIFVDTIKDVLPRKLAWLMKPFFSNLERWTISRAQTVNLVSEGFQSYFEQRYPSKRLSFYTNGIDNEFMASHSEKHASSNKAIFEVVYAGNFGEGQGLHQIIPGLAKHYEGRLRFKLIGDGGRKSLLEESLKHMNVNNVELVSPVERAELINIYQQADVLFLHLNDYDAFLKVLPSKIFEYAALGKPVWAGVSGYAARFLTEHVSNSAVFPPCNVEQAVLAFKQLELVTQPRERFMIEFSREAIMKNMASDIIQLALHSDK